ncbi:MAG: DMT family transporter, partial [Alphaproteobacteria bacterium]
VAALGEPFGRREELASAAILTGSCLLPTGGGARSGSDGLGAAAVAGACACWAIDNTLTQRLSGRDPVVVAGTKSLLAGTASALLAATLGGTLPPAETTVAASLLGFASYGASLVLVVAAMRSLGAAREAALFSTAPFAGALLAVPLLGETLGPRELAAGALMAVGVASLAAAGSPDLHEHAEQEHEHAHRHDEHHLHDHAPGDPPGEPHVHRHRHDRLRHAHAWASDGHHGPATEA